MVMRATSPSARACRSSRTPPRCQGDAVVPQCAYVVGLVVRDIAARLAASSEAA